MKRVVLIGILASLVLLSSGCASVYNHNRVREDMIRDRIIANGSDEQLFALNQGVSPSEAVKVFSTSNGRGVGMSIDVSDLEGLAAWWGTFREAPISSTFALALDGAAIWGITELVEELESDEGSVTTTTTTPGVPPEGGNSLNVNIGDNNSDVDITITDTTSGDVDRSTDSAHYDTP